ncbi:uncharacterized protein Hap1MRO34_025594 [Clarias gariepinus]|uniref:uncharacterized protein LOC128512218 n=1 Tax=Clarias gariepinus TaxID=13013 RepID=UPI00234CC3E2|nr:uncharacterized protein LOC128512218 [Clarias gariepinus]
MMEMQQKHSRSLNVYDNSEELPKTEDIYQSLQQLPTVAARKASGKKIIVLLLFIINILLLVTILLVTGIHYYHFRQSHTEVLTNQKSTLDMWHLHAEKFYLFWSNPGDCHTAKRFCAQRTADLATVTKSNMDWLQSRINGKLMLVKMSQFHSSGDGFKNLKDYDMEDDQDEEEETSECEPLGATADLSGKVEGWICEKAAQRLN